MRSSAACASSLAAELLANTTALLANTAALLAIPAALLAFAAFAEEPHEQAELSAAEPGSSLAEPAVHLDAPELGLVELMDGMASASGVVASFREQKQIALLEKPLASSGTIYFVPPNRLVRFTSEPVPSALIIDGEKLRFQQGDGEKFDLSGNPMARIFIDNFIVLFNGDLPKLQELYHTHFSAEGGNWTLILEPRRSPLHGFVKEITLRGGQRGIREMVVQNRDGDRTATTLDVVSTDYRFTEDQLEDLFVEGTVPVTVNLR